MDTPKKSGARRRTARHFAAASLLGLALSGCGGGGGGGSTTPPPDPALNPERRLTRAVVRDARWVSHTVGRALSVVNNGGLPGWNTDGGPGRVHYDPEYGLFYRTQTREFVSDGRRIVETEQQFYADEAATARPVGWIRARRDRESPDRFPYSISLDSDLPGGTRPERGHCHLSVDSPTRAAMTGDVVETLGGDEAVHALVLNPVAGTASGRVRLFLDYPTRAEEVYLNDVSLTAEQGMAATIAASAAGAAGGGVLRGGTGRSGSLEITTPRGRTVAAWGASGLGSLTPPGRAAEQVPDFDIPLP